MEVSTVTLVIPAKENEDVHKLKVLSMISAYRSNVTTSLEDIKNYMGAFNRGEETKYTLLIADLGSIIRALDDMKVNYRIESTELDSVNKPVILERKDLEALPGFCKE